MITLGLHTAAIFENFQNSTCFSIFFTGLDSSTKQTLVSTKMRAVRAV